MRGGDAEPLLVTSQLPLHFSPEAYGASLKKNPSKRQKGHSSARAGDPLLLRAVLAGQVERAGIPDPFSIEAVALPKSSAH